MYNTKKYIFSRKKKEKRKERRGENTQFREVYVYIRVKEYNCAEDGIQMTRKKKGRGGK